MRRGILLGCCLTALFAFSCKSMPNSSNSKGPDSLSIVTICNHYVPSNSKAAVFQLVDHAKLFSGAVNRAGLHGAWLTSLSDGNMTHTDLVETIARHDTPNTLTIAYIASHGYPEGFVLPEPLSFEELYRNLAALTKGKVLLVVDMCYAGNLNRVLANNHSTRIFAITGTKDSSLERWYCESGSFGKAVSNAIAAKDNPWYGGRLTFGQFYDKVDSDIRDWNSRYIHPAGPISEAGMYGPRDLVLFDSNS